MAKLGPEEKRVFVIASGNPKRITSFSQIVSKHIQNSVIFSATDGFDAFFKLENAPPHVLIVDIELPKMSGIDLTSKVFANYKLVDTSVIIVSPIPDREHFVDQVVTGQVQFLSDPQNENLISTCITRALNRLVDSKNMSYSLRFLNSQEVLFREGEKAQALYFVKRGEMEAFKGPESSKKVLGMVNAGEFVGEMAHIHGEPRSATVKALADCELIEIPFDALDTVLFSKPAWSKALVATLSKRLKRMTDSL